ncbi:MAG: PEGA domain-containing protein [Fibromonadaceae bacterium]|jgi:hypothetical protein|nr:PEGA domain-containing protein [Fibromonadaceae bacterium]
MKKTIAFLLLTLTASVFAQQRQRVAVLPSIADQEAKLNERQLDMLTDKVRSIAVSIMPQSEFNLLKQDFVKDQLGEETLYEACKEGTCVGSLMEKVQADFGARSEVFTMDKKLYLKFELYGTLKGQTEAGTIFIIPGKEVKDITAMLALLDKEVPIAFKKIATEPAPPPAQAQMPIAPAMSGSYAAMVETEPAGATLNLNGVPYQGCAKTPCQISLYENRVKLQAVLTDHETADTSITITQPNQLVKIKLKPVIYNVIFATEPAGAELTFSNDCTGASCIKASQNACPQTPCRAAFTKGNIKVGAKLELYETADTSVFISEKTERIAIKLKPNYGTLNVNPIYTDGIGKDRQWSFTLGGSPAQAGEIKLLPGNYAAKLTHGCYEDIAIDSISVKKNEEAFLDMSQIIALKQSNLTLEAKYKGRNQKKPVFVNGKQAGETPFSGSVPMCSQIEVDGKKVNVNLEHNKSAAYTHNLPTWKSTLLSVAIGAVGTWFILNGIAQTTDALDYMDEYDHLGSGTPAEYNNVRKKVKDANIKAPIYFGIGSGLVVSAIGVYLWF